MPIDFEDSIVSGRTVQRRINHAEPNYAPQQLEMLRRLAMLLEGLLQKEPATVNPAPVNVQVQPRANKRVECEIKRNAEGQATKMIFTEYSVD